RGGIPARAGDAAQHRRRARRRLPGGAGFRERGDCGGPHIAVHGRVSRERVVEPHLRILHTVAQAISHSLDVDEVLRTAVEALTHVTGHEMASLHLLSPDGVQLHLKGERGLPQKLRDVNMLLPLGRGQLGGVARTGKTLVLKNATEDAELLPQAREVMAEYRIRGLVCVAIHSRDRILGTLTLGRRTEDLFTERDIALLEATADT